MLTDNLPYTAITEIKSLENKQWEILNSVSHRTIEELCESEKGLLVFPHCLGNCKKEFREANILKISKNQISTGNIVGFIGVKDKASGESVELTIHSRFQKGENGEDYFLHYMLQKVFNITILDLKHSTANDDVFDFAMYLFPHYLKRAVKQGLFKQYRKCEYNDANVRGAIDVSRHIRQNIPFNGRIAYRTSEYKYDNAITQLIRHTIEYIRTSKWAGNILKCDKDMCDNVRTIYDITPSYKPNDRQRVIAQNLKPISHPFYTEYRMLQQLCLNILRHKGVKYGNSGEKIYGILFDCTWLWEEYLATILPKEFTHAVRGKGNGIKLFNGGQVRYPDFYCINEGVVLDAKYKRIDNGVQRNDLYQLISYIHALDRGNQSDRETCGAFIYPTSAETTQSVWAQLCGYGGRLGKIPMFIPNNCDSFSDFHNSMIECEQKFIDDICSIAERNFSALNTGKLEDEDE